MNTIELRINSRLYYFTGPSAWSELSTNQAVALTRLRSTVLNSAKNGMPAELFSALTLLYKIKPRQQRWLFDDDFLRRKGVADRDRPLILEQGQCLLDSMNWITEAGTDPVFPARFRRYDYRFGTPAVLLSRLLSRTQFTGPAEGLGTATFETFIAADKAYHDNDLPRLAATLYETGLRVTTIDERANLLKDADHALLQLIADRFGSTLRLLQRCFRRVFPRSLPVEETNKTAGSKKDSTVSWLDVAISMAKLDVTKIREIEQVNVYLALKVLEEQLRQAEIMEAAVARHNH